MGVPSKLKASTGKKAARVAYAQENRAAKNKAVRLARHLRNHPNDAQTIDAIKNLSTFKVRAKPVGRVKRVSKFGYIMEGTRPVKDRKTGKTVQVDYFTLHGFETKTGFVSNFLVKIRPNYSMKTRTPDFDWSAARALAKPS